MKKSALIAVIAVVGLASGAADAAIATFHCDAAPVEECHYVVFDGAIARPVAIVKGGEALTVDRVGAGNTYCREVNADPDVAGCAHESVPFDADFKDRVDSSQPRPGAR